MGQTLCGKSESAIPGIRVEGKERSGSITAYFLNKEKKWIIPGFCFIDVLIHFIFFYFLSYFSIHFLQQLFEGQGLLHSVNGIPV